MVTGGRHAMYFNQDQYSLEKNQNQNQNLDPGKSVELLNPNGSRNCSLKDLPDERVLHSQTWLHTCGGVDVGDGSIKDRASNESSQRVPSSASLPPGC